MLALGAMARNDAPYQPGHALNRLLFVAFLGWVFYRLAAAGWAVMWLGVVMCGVGLVPALRDLVRAHRAWVARRRLEVLANEITGVYDTGWRESPKGKRGRDRGWH